MATSTRTLEREIKLDFDLLSPGPQLDSLPKGARVRPLPEAELTTVYLDTPDLRLAERELSLRHRSVGGGNDDGTWTLKLPGGGRRHSLARTEVSWSGGPSVPPAEALEILSGVLRFAHLSPIVDLVTQRRRWAIESSAGHALAELDDDTVTVRGGPADGHRFRQLELEIEEADSSFVDSLTKRLKRSEGSKGYGSSKLSEALGVARPPEAVARQSTTSRTTGLAEVVRRTIQESFARLVDNDLLLRIDLGDAEALHQARVATRRLRSDLKTFGHVLDAVWVDHMRTDLKWAGAAFGSVRDLDVLAGRFRPLLADLRSVGPEAAEHVNRRLNDDGRRARESLRRVMGATRYLLLVDRLHAASLRPPLLARRHFRGSVSSQTQKRVRRPWRALRRAVAAAGDAPSADELHRVRIQAKQLRYAAEASSLIAGKRAGRTASSAERLQQVLGDHHDAIGAEQWLLQEAASASAPVAFLIGQLLSRERRQQEEIAHSWRAIYRRLERQAGRWPG